MIDLLVYDNYIKNKNKYYCKHRAFLFPLLIFYTDLELFQTHFFFFLFFSGLGFCLIVYFFALRQKLGSFKGSALIEKGNI